MRLRCAMYGTVALASLAAACRAAPPPVAAPTPPPAPLGVEHDVCEVSPPIPHALNGILRNARCDQDMYVSMSHIADMLGVECTHCHAAKVEGKKDRDFPKPTHKKEIANWMSLHFMQSVKPADGSPMQCASCHTDAAGRPVAKILGEPRDPIRANEWMTLVLVKKFVAADGSKLKCKSCHAGAPGMPDFRKLVILQTELLPKHAIGVKGTPGF